VRLARDTLHDALCGHLDGIVDRDPPPRRRAVLRARLVHRILHPLRAGSDQERDHGLLRQVSARRPSEAGGGASTPFGPFPLSGPPPSVISLRRFLPLALSPFPLSLSSARSSVHALSVFFDLCSDPRGAWAPPKLGASPPPPPPPPPLLYPACPPSAAPFSCAELAHRRCRERRGGRVWGSEGASPVQKVMCSSSREWVKCEASTLALAQGQISHRRGRSNRVDSNRVQP
jgi:hypothetical protein